jgi:Domain of unknown function (DUF427)
MEMMTKTDHSTHCPWKGEASYYTINLDSERSGECLDGVELIKFQRRSSRMQLGTILILRRRPRISKIMLLFVSV